MIVKPFLAAALAGTLAACGAPRQSAEDFHLIPGGFDRGRGPDGNTEIYDGPNGLIVIDTGRHPAHAQNILDYATTRGKPIAAIVNTHWHLDHTTGNTDIKAVYPSAKVYATPAIHDALAGFLARGAARTEEILKTKTDLPESELIQIRRGLDTIRNPEALIPDVPVTGPMTLAVNGRDLELYVTHDAATASDIWIWDPATKTAIVGDLVTFPAPFFDTGCVAGWRAAFAAIEEKPYERIAPGHGRLLTPAEFRRYVTAFDDLAVCAEKYAGAECGAQWLAETSDLMNDWERENAVEYAEYYVDEVLKSAEHQAEFCPAG